MTSASETGRTAEQMRAEIADLIRRHVFGSLESPRLIAEGIGNATDAILAGPIAQLRSRLLEAEQGAEAMRERCAVECEEVSNERWGYTEKFVIKGLHDKAAVESGAVGGARECAERIRALNPNQEAGDHEPR